MGKNKKSQQEKKRGHKVRKENAENNAQEPVIKDNKINAPVEETPSGDGHDAGSENGTGPETSAMPDEKVLLAGLEEKLKEKEDKYLRLAAEFDNYRKRTLREKAELSKLVGSDIISGLLPVIDDLDRAIESMADTKDVDAMQKGIMLIRDKFREFLKQKGVSEIRALGLEFDTDLHEAITKIPAPDKKDKGKIVDVILKGYILHDKVIRYAKVVVGE
jgi:molecular chaperone GrpE